MRVAVCDQLEDPKKTKTIVKRGITEVVTPGVSINDNVLNHKENNFLASVHLNGKSVGLAFLDISTGEFLTAEGTPEYADKLINSFSPKEVLHERNKRKEFAETFGNKLYTYEQEDWIYTADSAHDRLLKHFETSNLKGFGVDNLPNGIIAAGAILYYLDHTQHTNNGHITRLARIEEDRFVWLDRFTVRNLELFSGQQEGAISLTDVLDKTVTPMGSRLLKRWVSFPLKNLKQIEERHNVVEHFFKDVEMKEMLGQQLALVGDLERIVSKIAVGRVSPREVVQLKVALSSIEPIKEACLATQNATLHKIGEQSNPCEKIRERIDREIQNDPPNAINRAA